LHFAHFYFKNIKKRVAAAALVPYVFKYIYTVFLLISPTLARGLKKIAPCRYIRINRAAIDAVQGSGFQEEEEDV
jgi:hypothetical protein